MSAQARIEGFLKEVRQHLHKELIPFWATHGVESEYGGFLTYLDEKGTAKQYWPEHLEVIDDMPRTPSGKIQKFKLREMAKAFAR